MPASPAAVGMPGSMVDTGATRRSHIHALARPAGSLTGVAVLPKSGDVLRVTKAASVQFTDPVMFRVIRVHDWSTYDGWAWLDGYQLNASGDAVERRSIFVQLKGLQPVRVNHLGVPPRPRVAVG
jgi:hypothetical protein